MYKVITSIQTLTLTPDQQHPGLPDFQEAMFAYQCAFEIIDVNQFWMIDNSLYRL